MKKCTPVLVQRGLAGLRVNPGPGLLIYLDKTGPIGYNGHISKSADGKSTHLEAKQRAGIGWEPAAEE